MGVTPSPLHRCTAAICTGLAAAAIAAAGAPAQQYAQPGRPLSTVGAPGCTRTGAKTIKANRHVRVFSVLKRGYGAVYGCQRSARRAFRLGILGECQNSREIRMVEVAGRRAVLGIFECSLYAGGWNLELVNLRNGHREFTSNNPISVFPPTEATHDSLQRMVLTADGSVAWTAARSGAGAAASYVEVRRRRRGSTNQAVLLDSGTDIDAQSLRKRGRTISWTKAGVRRTAQL